MGAMGIDDAILLADMHTEDEVTFRCPVQVGMLRHGMIRRVTQDEVARSYGLVVDRTYLGGVFTQHYLLIIRGKGKHVSQYMALIKELVDND